MRGIESDVPRGRSARTLSWAAVVALATILGLQPAAAKLRSEALRAPPQNHVAAANEIRQAWRARDVDRIEEQAEKDIPDPWLVAEELCNAREFEAAMILAWAARRTDVARLADYVKTRREAPADDEAVQALAAVFAAMRREAYDEALAAAAALEGVPDTVTRIRVAFAQGWVSRETKAFENGARHFRRAAEAAEALGWFAQAQRTFAECGISAYRGSYWRLTEGAYLAVLRMARRRDDGPAAAWALHYAGMAQARMGRYDTAVRTESMALREFEELVDRRGAAEVQGNLGLIYFHRGEYEQALAAHLQAFGAWLAVGDAARLAKTLGNVGLVYLRQGRHRAALVEFDRALRMNEDLGDMAGVAVVLGNIAVAHEELGDIHLAVDHLQRALRLQEAIPDRAGVATTTSNLANQLMTLGDLPQALKMHEEVLDLRQKLDDAPGYALTLANIGAVYGRLTDYERALRNLEDALARMEALQRRSDAASTRSSLGWVHFLRGDFARGLTLLEEARGQFDELGEVVREAEVRQRIGHVYATLGNCERALSIQQATLGFMEKHGIAQGVAEGKAYLAEIYGALGETEKALTALTEALESFEARGIRTSAMAARANIGVLHRELGDPEASLRALLEAEEHCRAVADHALHAWILGEIGITYALLAKPREAFRFLRRGISMADSRRATPLVVYLRGVQAHLQLKAGESQLALAAARLARHDLEDLLGGLDETAGAFARAEHADIYSVGALAATRLEEPAELLTFLESGRASLLLESLGRRTLCWDALPESLRNLEAEARARVVRCRHACKLAAKRGIRRERQACEKKLEEALLHRRDVFARIQREAKRQAGIFYPRAAYIDEVQRRLPETTALVLYGLCFDEAIALVVTRGDAEIVPLGRTEEIVAACEALDLSEPDAEWKAGFARLRSLLVEPLVLGPECERVLISPVGPLCYLPFGALFPKRPVALTPSGTTHVHLVEEQREPGEKVLALGDAIYKDTPSPELAKVYRYGERLLPLPASRREAEAIGDVLLLGPFASESDLWRAIAQNRRWRAVHLACHAIVDAEHPLLSYLAISQQGDDDGLLTLIEVLRRQIPADLVVLSACETARGRVFRGEGIIGLTRAFMYAGAPRVICSLWKVDDEATRAFMEKFYALWNPKDGSPSHAPDAALKAAQRHVRQQEGWEHPFYWAAWTLWGLPD